MFQYLHQADQRKNQSSDYFITVLIAQTHLEYTKNYTKMKD